MKRIMSRITFANVMASIAVFLTLGGTAMAVKQVTKNSVNSKSIKNGTVTGKDVKNEALTGADVNESTLKVKPTGTAGGDLAGDFPNPRIGPDTLGSEEIADGTILADDIFPGAISGPQVNEQGLDIVPAATTAVQGGYGRYGFDGACNPANADVMPCQVVPLNLRSPARLLITGTAEAVPEVNKLAAMGRCQIGTTSGPIEASSIFVPIMPTDQDYSPGTRAVQRTLTAVTDPFPVGGHAVGIDCADLSSAGSGIRFPQVRLSVVALSAE